MALTIANVARGTFGYYGTLPAANDGLVAIPLETTGIESDATLQDYATVATMLAASNNEQTTMGRKALTSVTCAPDNTGNKRVLDFADVTYTAATGNACSKICIAYDPDTTGGTDADLIPLFYEDFVVTPAGGDITYTVNASGLAEA